MKIDITSLDGEAAGSIDSRRWIFGLEPRADLIARMVRWQLAKRRAGTHQSQAAPTSSAPARRCTSRRAPAAPVTARRACRSSAAADAPSARSCAAMRMTCRRRCARWRSSMRFPPKSKDGGIIVWETRAARRAPRRRSLRLEFRQARPRRTRSSSTAPSRRTNFALAARNIPKIDVLPVAGHQCLRHPAPREAGLDQAAAVDALEARFK